MVVILPPSAVDNVLQLLSDPAAVKANIKEMQGMAEQYQRDAKKAYEENIKLQGLKKDLEAKEESIAATLESQDNRAAELTSYMALLSEREAKVSERERACSYREEVYANQADNYSVRADEQNKRENSLDVQEIELREGYAKLAQDKKAHEEWQLSISSILSSKP